MTYSCNVGKYARLRLVLKKGDKIVPVGNVQVTIIITAMHFRYEDLNWINKSCKMSFVKVDWKEVWKATCVSYNPISNQHPNKFLGEVAKGLLKNLRAEETKYQNYDREEDDYCPGCDGNLADHPNGVPCTAGRKDEEELENIWKI